MLLLSELGEGQEIVGPSGVVWVVLSVTERKVVCQTEDTIQTGADFRRLQEPNFPTEFDQIAISNFTRKGAN